MRDGPTLAEQLAAEFKGDTLEQMCLGKGGTLTCNDYWGLRRYLLPDQSVVVLQKLGGQAMTVDATDSESIKAYCQAFRFDAREVNFFAYMVLSEAAITKAKNEARGTSRSPM